ncbi:hypothetical protein [Streptomyces sp. NBC_01565]|uniref:hypothetical protein n=1 Tax=unclassified Streptomyces TaxID=2593676 RepID=UPI00224FD4B1|nr:hypothetical protein [Streptomyces sp. NBC_01565]MCX4545684.1 hypothetical protein [Streptomyces sp. NBC_01565]
MIETRGRTASWCRSRADRDGRLLAWTVGFRLTREYVRLVTGRPLARRADGVIIRA